MHNNNVNVMLILVIVIVMDFSSSSFNGPGSESGQIISVQIMILEGIVSSKNIDVNVTFFSVTADG